MQHNILYVEDNECLSEAIRAYLGRDGVTVDCVSNVAKARELLARKRYSLVLVDSRLSASGLEGFDFACSVRETSPWLPLLIFTGCSSPELDVESARRDIEVVTKPKPLPELKRIIQQIFEERYERPCRTAAALYN